MTTQTYTPEPARSAKLSALHRRIMLHELARFRAIAAPGYVRELLLLESYRYESDACDIAEEVFGRPVKDVQEARNLFELGEALMDPITLDITTCLLRDQRRQVSELRLERARRIDRARVVKQQREAQLHDTERAWLLTVALMCVAAVACLFVASLG